jgi:GT2 family glycosyltransferase
MERKFGQTPAGFIDRIDTVGVSGWSVNPSNLDFSDEVFIHFGNAYSLSIRTSFHRTDIASQGCPDNKSGFLVEFDSIPYDELVKIDSEISKWPSNLPWLSGSSKLTDTRLDVLAHEAPEAIVGSVLRRRAAKEKLGLIGHVDNIDRGLIRGWAVFQHSELHVAIRLIVDGRYVSSGTASLDRRDVEASFGKLEVGFELPLPLQFYDGKPHIAEIVESASGLLLDAPFMFVLQPLRTLPEVPRITDELRDFINRANKLFEKFEAQGTPSVSMLSEWHRVFLDNHRLNASEIREQRERQLTFSFRPKISVICPTYNTDIGFLRTALDSVIHQTYDNFEIIIADDCSTDTATLAVAEFYASRYPDKVRVLRSTVNLGIAANTNKALLSGIGDFVVFFDHDDVLEPDALYALVSVQQDRVYDLIYTDEDSVDTKGYYSNPHFKPSWDPILLAGLNYICHLVMVSRALLDKAGPLDEAFDGAQDKEFLLRIARVVNDRDVLHIPRVLYHWRFHSESTSKNPSKIKAIEDRSKHASADWAAHYFPSVSLDHVVPSSLFAFRVRPAIERDFPRVSVIIPTRDRMDFLIPCVSSIQRDGYPNLEIIIVNHQSAEKFSSQIFELLRAAPNIKIIDYSGPFNWSSMNNLAVDHATGSKLLFLNNDTEFLNQNSINELVAFSCYPNAGVVGATLFYPSGQIQHAGVVVGPSGIAGHCFSGLNKGDAGYNGYPLLSRSVAAVTGACMLVSVDIFKQVNGFDDVGMRVALSDIDFCLKVQQAGYRNIMAASVELVHYESISRGSDAEGAAASRFAAESQIFRILHEDIIGSDPFYSPSFDNYAEPYKYIKIARGAPYDFRKQKT